jgi:hypothetical protein
VPKRLALVVLALAYSTTNSSALDATVSKVTSASPAQAWDAVGDFCGISTWHPLVSACELAEVMGAKLRRITLTNGGTIREQLVEQNNGAKTQRYWFLDGALPVSNYQATLKVDMTEAGTTYNWSGNFEANAVSDAEAIKSITEFYSVGIDALVRKSSK